MANVMTAAECEELNELARQLVRQGYDPLTACEQVADEAGLVVAIASEDCMVLRTAEGRLVNLWTQGVQSNDLADGGIGYDDQVEWAEDQLDLIVSPRLLGETAYEFCDAPGMFD